MEAAPPTDRHAGDSVIGLLDVMLLVAATVAAFLLVGGVATLIFQLAHGSQHLSSKALEQAISKNAFFLVPTQFAVYLAILSFMAVLVWQRYRMPLFTAIRWNAPHRARALSAVVEIGRAHV